MTTTYKLVPIEPTEEMIKAGLNAEDNYSEKIAWTEFDNDYALKFAYKAMLEAAPAQESEPVAFQYYDAQYEKWDAPELLDATYNLEVMKFDWQYRFLYTHSPAGVEPVASIVHTIGTGILEGQTIPRVLLDFKYIDLPIGTKLYTHPPADKDAEQAVNDALEKAAKIAESYEPDEKQSYITYASRDIRALIKP